MEYFVADSYEGFELIGEPFTKSGKLYTKARQNCDRCVKGVYACRVENNQIVPHPAYGGVCLKCGGTGFITKEIRLYTEKEKAAAVRSKERAAERRVAEKLASAEKKRVEWLSNNNFTEDGMTTVYVGSNSFEIKAELKENGWTYSPLIGWHIGRVNVTDYDLNNLAEISVDDVAAFNLYGEGCWLSTAKNFVEQIKNDRKPLSLSEWVGIEKEKITNIPVTVKSIRGFQTRFGWTNVITFLNGENILTWFTTTTVKFAVGESCYLSATIKEHNEYNNEKQTVVKNCKLTKELV